MASPLGRSNLSRKSRCDFRARTSTPLNWVLCRMMDAADFLREFQDYMAPTLDTYEQAIYLYCVRHSRLLGLDECVVGFKSARRNMAFGIGKAGTAMSEGICYEKVRNLEQKGYLVNLGSERQGTRIRVLLPSEIDGLIPDQPSIHQVPSKKLTSSPPKIVVEFLKRDGFECFYCHRKVDEHSYVIEHVISRPAGDNSYRNLVTSCRRCNNRKSDIPPTDFFRSSYQYREERQHYRGRV